MHTNQHTSLARIHTHGEWERSGAEHHTHQHSCFSQESPVFNIHLPPLPVLLFLPANSRNLYGPSLVISYEYSNQYFIPRLSSCQILYETHHLTQSTQYPKQTHAYSLCLSHQATSKGYKIEHRKHKPSTCTLSKRDSHPLSVFSITSICSY